MQNIISNTFETKLHDEIIKLCHSMELNLNDNHKGPKIYTNYQRVALIILFLRSRKSLRDFAKELFESRWIKWLGLREIPSFRSIHEWLKRWDLKWVRKLLEQISTKSNPRTMAIDATGFDSWKRSRHYERRLKDFGVHNPHTPYAKVDFLVDTDSKIIHDFVLRTKPRHETKGARTIFKRMKQKQVLILADKGYDSEELHEIAIEKGNLMYAPIRDFKVKKPSGKNRRRCWKEKPENAGMRSIVEAVIYSMKTRVTSLRSKLHYMKKREMAWNIITYNLEIMIKHFDSLIKLLCKLVILNRAIFVYLIQ